jgi:hypothetical protein
MHTQRHSMTTVVESPRATDSIPSHAQSVAARTTNAEGTEILYYRCTCLYEIRDVSRGGTKTKVLVNQYDLR